MNQKQNLRNYLIKYFLIILALVGVAQLGLNLLYHSFAYPWLEQTYGLSGLLDEATLSETLATFLYGFFWLIIGNLASGIPGGVYLKNSASRQLENHLLGRFIENTDSTHSFQSELYLSSLICFFVLLLLVWLLPYVLAAVSFGMIVSKKAAAIEVESLAKQQEYERQRNLLLSDVAHDLKTPLTTVAGYAKALADNTVTDPEKQQDYLNAMYRKSMQINELLLLLFEYVKLDSAGFSLKREETDLCELLRSTVVELYTDFEDSDMELSVHIPEDVVLFSADQIQFPRAIHNLLVNAMKHNPKGTKVDISLETSANRILIRISDSGVPIPEETAAHLFEPFVQGDASRTSKSGNGLGLSITEKIISMHGGTIVLQQDEPKGFTKCFLITLKNEHPDY